MHIGFTLLSHGHLFCYSLLDAIIQTCDAKSRVLVKVRSELIVALDHFWTYSSLLFPLTMVIVIALELGVCFSTIILVEEVNSTRISHGQRIQ